jgi:ribose transport system ATP-binding protein
VFLLDEPTRGVDIGAKQEIYRLMEELAATGASVLFVSSDLEEILGMSDRVLVLHEGRLSGELPRNELSEEAVMRLATAAQSEATASPI